MHATPGIRQSKFMQQIVVWGRTSETDSAVNPVTGQPVFISKHTTGTRSGQGWSIALRFGLSNICLSVMSLSVRV